MPRKTVAVADLVERANRFLAIPASTSALETGAEQRASRLGAIAMLESVLFETGQYKGFSFQASEVDSEGQLILDADTTRRRYH